MRGVFAIGLVTLIGPNISIGLAATQSFLNDSCRRLIVNSEKLSDSEKLKRFFEIDAKQRSIDDPEFEIGGSDSHRNRHWRDLSIESFDKKRTQWEASLEVLKRIDPKVLSDDDKINYQLFLQITQDQLKYMQFRPEYMRILSMGGFYDEIPNALSTMPARNVSDFEDQLARLKGAQLFIEQNMILLRKGLALGITPPRVTLQRIPESLKGLLEQNPEKNPILASFFKKMPPAVPLKEQVRLRAEANHILVNSVLPSLNQVDDFLRNSYLPGCRESIAWTALYRGKEWYEFLVKRETTTSLTPAAIHSLGLAEVERIEKEMKTVMYSLHFQGSLNQFFHFLKTNPRFFYDKKEDLISGYQDIARKVNPYLPRLFVDLPELAYEIRPTPSYNEIGSAAGFYDQGSIKLNRKGVFYANTYDLRSRPKWGMTTLFLHEAVPGHHLQITLEQMHKNIPQFRTYFGFTAFLEGWALYAESLGKEMGLYEDSYSYFGKLSSELWRSIRLVVDTGIHSKGWSRERAIQFFKDHSPKSDFEIHEEVDRYISWPAQALAYKLGQLQIQKLKDTAKQRLGSRFDIRRFHQAVLKNGQLPLDILETTIEDWIEKEGRNGTHA